jgi:sugar phosphate isomerase/epimerase
MSTHDSCPPVASRRQFLQAASFAVACGSVGGAVLGQAPARARGATVAPTIAAPNETLAERLGVASYSFRNFSLDQTIAMTKRLGMKYLCLKSFHLPLDAKPEALKAAADKIKKAGLVLYGGGGIAMRSSSEIEQAFEYAKHAGMKIMIIMPTLKTLPEIERKVKQYDIAVAVHNHGPGDKHFPTGQSAYKHVKDLDPRIGLCVDVGHTTRYGEDACLDLEACADRVYDIHFKDVTAANARGIATVFGRGVMDMPRLFRTIHKIGFPGILGFEYESEARDPLVSMAECAGYARGMLAGMGK